MPIQSRPPWVKKVLSSAEMKASISCARHLVDGHEEAALFGIFGQQRAVGRMDAGHHRRLVLRELLVVGKILRDVPDHIGKSGRSPEKEHEADREQPTEKPQHVAGFAT